LLYPKKIIKIPNNIIFSSSCFIIVHSITVTQFSDHTVTTRRSLVKVAVTDGNSHSTVNTISPRKMCQWY